MFRRKYDHKPLTGKQKAYREFLKTPFWKDLSKQKRELVGCCENCKDTERLQAHHKQYPKNLFDTKLEDLEVLCRVCHRIEHGLPVLFPFEKKRRELNSKLNHEIPITHEELVEWAGEIISTEDERELKGMIRLIAMMRPPSGKWEKAPREVKMRLWPWSERKLQELKKESGNVREALSFDV